MMASEGGAISWVAMHRIHHARSDQPGQDLHTPKDGFWWSHMGWIVAELGMDYREMERRYAPELVADPVHRVLNRIHVLPNILVGLALYAWGGWSLVVWGVFVRLVITLHGTWLVNSATHVWGYRTWKTNEDSRNLWWVGLLAWGEGWHNTHHAFQRSARHGFEWWEFDATWLVIRALAAVGLAKDIHLLPKNAERFRIRDRDEPPGGGGLTVRRAPSSPGRGGPARSRISPRRTHHVRTRNAGAPRHPRDHRLHLRNVPDREPRQGPRRGHPQLQEGHQGRGREDESGDQPKAS